MYGESETWSLRLNKRIVLQTLKKALTQDGMRAMQLQRKLSFYERYIKRILDIICAVLAIIFFWWLYAIIAILVRVNMGKPVLFKQPRPGQVDPKTGQEKIFDIYKFRTMSDTRDENGDFLPDEIRLGKFGKALRATSLDEMPEVFNILRGDLSVIGPRPQLVRDMVFMSKRQRMRHTAKPGLSGLAQVKGRNAISWEEKLEWDLKYIENVSFVNDVKIIIDTVKKVFFRTNITETSKEIDVTLDFGDALLQDGNISRSDYDELQRVAREMIAKHYKSA